MPDRNASSAPATPIIGASRAEPSFRELLVEQIPALRGYARALTRNHASSDDLVQETLLKAWAAQGSFEPGTNLRAWLSRIMRNAWLTTVRNRRREVEDVDGGHAALVACPPSQEHALTVKELQAALDELPPAKREALTLVCIMGLSHEEAAEIQGVAVGTTKSRVNRARAYLAERLGLNEDEALPSGKRFPAAPLLARAA